MANRYVCTLIHEKSWYRDLTPELKAIWKFLTDRCDHAGVWDIDHGAFKYFVGSDLTIEEVLKVPAFAKRFQTIDDKLFCPGFVSYQYKSGLNPENRAHVSVIQRLKRLGIDLTPFLQQGPYNGPFKGRIDKDIDKVLEKDITEILKNHYPLQIGIDLGVAKLLSLVTASDLVDLKASVQHFANYTRRIRTDEKYIKHPKTFADEWRNWIDEDAGAQRESVNLVHEDFKKRLEDQAINSTSEGLREALSDPKIAKIYSRIKRKTNKEME